MESWLFPGNLPLWVGWMVFAVFLAIGEIVLPGIFLIWIAIAAAITGAIAWSTPLDMPAQILIFAGLCLAITWVARRWYAANPVPSADPMLNDRPARLVGRQVVVIEAIVGGEGRVRIDDGAWNAVGPDAAVGDRLVVVAASGTTLTVERPRA